MSQLPSPEALRVLDAVARGGSFAAAAEELHRVPSAVSYLARRLEDDVGVKLFDRSGRRATLTAAGRLVLEEGRRILAASNALSDAARRVAGGWETEITIAVDTLFELRSIYPLVAELYDVNPSMRVHVIEEVLGGSWEALAQGRADMVVGAAQVQPGRGYPLREIGRVEFVFAAAPEHRIVCEPQPIAPEVLQRYRGVVAADSARSGKAMTTGVLDRQPVLAVPTLGDKIEAQRRGLGVGFLPRHRITGLLRRRELVELELQDARLPQMTYLAWRRERPGRALQWLLRRLQPPTVLQSLLGLDNMRSLDSE